MAYRSLVRFDGEDPQPPADWHKAPKPDARRLWRGALVVLAGAASSVVALQGLRLLAGGGPGPPPGPPSCAGAPPRAAASPPPRPEADGGKYAFVQIAHDEDPGRPRSIWRAMATARALQRLSRYPLVVLTNATRLPGGADVARSLARLNAQVLPVYDVGMPHGALSDDQQRYGLWKLQIWRLTQFDKLIWLDTSAVLTRSVDWLFKRRATWLQGDGGSCGTRAGRLPGDGIMLVAPSEAVYQHMVRFAATLSAEWWAASSSVSQYIGEYMQRIESRPVRLLLESTASWTSCLGRLPGVAGAGGAWELPAFVRATSEDEACFYWDMAGQLDEVEGQMVNVCHFHPLGQYWRSLFCDAAAVVGSATEAIEAFCDDRRWNSIGSLQVDLAPPDKKADVPRPAARLPDTRLRRHG